MNLGRVSVPFQPPSAAHIPKAPGFARGMLAKLRAAVMRALCGIAAYYHVAADPVHLSRELALQDRQADENDIVRVAMLIGLKAKLLVKVTATRLATLPTPAIVRLKNGSFQG